MIYLLEDDESIRKLVIYALESQKFEVKGFDTPSHFYEAMKEQVPDLVVLDIMLPEEDGISILKQIRKSMPLLTVMMLTAKNTEYDRVEGLDAGADDYISKPFGIMELMARIRALLRRSGAIGKPDLSSIRIEDLEIYPEQYEVKYHGEPIALTYKEFQLLCLLAQNSGIVLTREILLEKIWGLRSERENRTLDVHIRTLRSKLGSAGAYIQTVRGVGYRFSDQVDHS